MIDGHDADIRPSCGKPLWQAGWPRTQVTARQAYPGDAMEFGSWRLDVVSGGNLRMDGGAMFGVVPKPLWEKRTRPDEANRIPMATNCLLARDGERTLLVDTGPGGKFDERQREIFALRGGEPLLENLAALGVSPEDIDTVLLSHLHFDHAGGATRNVAGRLVPTFPRARHVVQRCEWDAATSGAAELEGVFPEENFRPLEESGLIELIDGDVEIVHGWRSIRTPGHTPGHQSLALSAGRETTIYMGDVCPTQAHLSTFWCMAFDLDLLESRRQKAALLGRIADEDALALFCHDPKTHAARIRRHSRRDFVVEEAFAEL